MVTTGYCETTGVINEAVLKEVHRHRRSKNRKILLTILFTMLTADIAFLVFDQSYTTVLIILGFITVYFLSYSYFVWRSKKLNAQRIKECGYTDTYTITTSFDNEGVTTFHHETNTTSMIKYEDFSRIVETEDVFIIITRAKLFTLVFKSDLNEAEQAAFISFLKGNFPNLQYELKRKK